MLWNFVGPFKPTVSLWPRYRHLSHHFHHRHGLPMPSPMVAAQQSSRNHSHHNLFDMVRIESSCSSFQLVLRRTLDHSFFCWSQRPVIIFHNYFRAVYLGPGFVPINWRPVSWDLTFLTSCWNLLATSSLNRRRKTRKMKPNSSFARFVTLSKRPDHITARNAIGKRQSLHSVPWFSDNKT